MRVLSIDVGIKNLAFCLFEKNTEASHFNIVKWDIVNLSQEDEILKCVFIDKKGVCDKPAKYLINKNDSITSNSTNSSNSSNSSTTTCFCLKHSKKQDYQIPTSELKPSFINKQKIQKLIELADKYEIQYEKPIKKNDLLFKITEYITNKCFKEVSSTNASQVDLITIGKNIKCKLNKIFPMDENIDYILIENQISPIASRMKTIQGMIAQYFIMNNNAENIEFVSSIHKLKLVTGSGENKEPVASDYKSRKKLGISKCLEFLTNDHRFNDKLDFFTTHKKKDDLSDAFLQGLWFINNKI
jgi:hypothetical protein